MAVIDCHTHILPPEIVANRARYCERDRWFGVLYEPPKARMATVEQLLASMTQAGVDRSVAFGFAFADPGLCRLCNDYVLSSAREHQGEILPFAVVAPDASGHAETEAVRCLELGAVGLGELMPDAGAFGADDRRLEGVMTVAQQACVPVMIHVNEQLGHDYRGKGTFGPVDGYRLAQRFPVNKFIYSHWGGGLAFYELMPEVRETLTNVCYDTAASPFLYDDAIFGHLMGWAASKILFGSDYPLMGQRRFVRRLAEADLGPDNLRSLMGANLEKVLAERDRKGGAE